MTAVGQVFVLVGASVIGLIVAARLSPGPRLDAYFTASQLSVAALYVGQALRTSVPGLQVGGVVRAAILTRAALVMTAVVAVTLLVAVAIGPYLLPAVSRSAMRGDLAVLLPGAVLQVIAGYAAGRLAMAGRFAGVAGAYALGTILNAALLVGLIDGRGAELLAPAALTGWLASALLIGVLLWRAGPQHETAAVPAGEGAGAPAIGVLGATGRIVLSVVPVLAAQLVIVASVAAAASLRTGGSTIVSFAFLAINAVGTVAIAPIPIVLSSDLGATWDRRAKSLVPLMLSIVRLSVAVTMPLVLVLLLVGRPIADLKLGGLSPADVDDLFLVVLVLLPTLPLTAASMVGLVANVTLDRLGLLARALGLAGVGAAATIGVIVAAGGSLLELAVAASIWSAVLGAVTVVVALRSHALPAIGLVFAEALRVAAPASLVLLASLATGSGLATGLAWTLLGALVHLAWLRWRFPAELTVLVGAIVRR